MCVEDVHNGLGEIPGLHLRRLFEQDDQVAFGPKEVERDVAQVLRRQPAIFAVQDGDACVPIFPFPTSITTTTPPKL